MGPWTTVTYYTDILTLEPELGPWATVTYHTDILTLEPEFGLWATVTYYADITYTCTRARPLGCSDNTFIVCPDD